MSLRQEAFSSTRAPADDKRETQTGLEAARTHLQVQNEWKWDVKAFESNYVSGLLPEKELMSRVSSPMCGVELIRVV